MRLVSYGDDRGFEQPGALNDDDRVVPLRPLLDAAGIPNGDMNGLLAHLDTLRPRIEERLLDPTSSLPLDAVRLGPPVAHPGAIVAVGANYAGHVNEVDVLRGQLPEVPVLFSKPGTALSGPHDPIVRPLESKELDYECELAVVVGRGGRRITPDQALGHVAGYMIANDVSARDIFAREMHRAPAFIQTLRGKGSDTFCPTGPWLLTADAVPDDGIFRLRTWVNDELRQDGTTAEMAFDVPTLVASVSASVTLWPGDVILTGTPAGVGYSMRPPTFLNPGDIVRMEISGLGVMVTPIHEET
jgi:2-keto-4-pentenoate hydratase/2-oxohepta-3-ene-1,7-dioic acid hydratase in catechol pathway